MGIIRNQKGFTLIEMIIVVATLAIALPVLFSIIFIIVNQQTKIIRLSEAKRQGDFAMSAMENIIKNSAESIYYPDPNTLVCIQAADSQPVTGFLDKTNGEWFSFSLNGAKEIASSSATAVTSVLTNLQVFVPGALTITCSRTNEYSPPVVNISFDICYNNHTGLCSSVRSEENITPLHYKSSVQLSTY